MPGGAGPPGRPPGGRGAEGGRRTPLPRRRAASRHGAAGPDRGADAVIAGLAITPGAALFCLAAVAAGAMVQRMAGQAFGMIAAPLVAMAAPGMVPGALLVIGLAVGLGATAVDLSAVDRRALPPGFAGRTLGAVLATLLLGLLPGPGAVSLTVAGVVMVGVALSLAGLSVPIRPATLFGAGVLAGLMGTLTAVGAPPMALLYQHAPARRSRAMQNVFFLWGMMVSIASLALAGLIGRAECLFALLMLPGVAAGLWAGGRLAGRLARGRIRPWALGLSAASAVALILRVWLVPPA